MQSIAGVNLHRPGVGIMQRTWLITGVSSGFGRQMTALETQKDLVFSTDFPKSCVSMWHAANRRAVGSF
jgi:hypothetical protein